MRFYIGAQMLSAEGERIEAPKAPGDVGIGRGVPSPNRLGVRGSVVNSPSGVRGGAVLL